MNKSQQVKVTEPIKNRPGPYFHLKNHNNLDFFKRKPFLGKFLHSYIIFVIEVTAAFFVMLFLMCSIVLEMMSQCKNLFKI